MSKDICYLTALDLAAMIRARKVSPVEVIDALADRIKRLNPKLNAYITLDLENARKDAQMKDKMRREHPDGDLGLLHGVPVAIKDDLEVAGLRYTMGSRLREKEIGKSDDLTVARLRKAGAIILGKTNEPEFGQGRHREQAAWHDPDAVEPGLHRRRVERRLRGGGGGGPSVPGPRH